MEASYTITLANGRNIYLEELHQYFTYAGLMEGLPSKEWNKEFIDEAFTKAERVMGYAKDCIYLVEPLERKEIRRIEVSTTGDLFPESEIKEVEYWELPAITCIGRFISYGPREETDEQFSTLIVIWHQDAFALPSEDNISEQIRTIDWHKHAIGGCF